jgi:poly(A) polymerase
MVNLAAQRELALDIVRRLRAAGFVAVWAGGCVRDQILGLTPKDYDVATSAEPAAVRNLFGQRRTLASGASFGVITVLGPRDAGQIDVATFRRDVSYTDGRRPDAVTFTSAQEDASRRDFTINGLFFDPVDEVVIDYVGGRDDLARGVVRAIGDPRQRFAEDKLRMLRGVRFAATLGFALDSATRDAIVAMAAEVRAVSAERISMEMRRMLAHANRAHALELLVQTGLLAKIVPQWERNSAQPEVQAERAFRLLGALPPAASFPLATASLLVALQIADAAEVCRSWRLSNDEIAQIAWLVVHARALDNARQRPWPQVQRTLIAPYISELLVLHDARVALADVDGDGAAFARERLSWPADKLNPPPLVGGNDLLRARLRPGPQFKSLLDSIRDAQLDGEITTADEAIALAQRLLAPRP